MPAKSQAQRELLNAKFGHAWVKRHHFDNKGKLPAHVKKGKKRMAKKHKHTGPVTHDDMHDHLRGHGGKDPHASAEHHAANKEHGMAHAMGHVEEEYDEGQHHGTGSKMSENCDYGDE